MAELLDKGWDEGTPEEPQQDEELQAIEDKPQQEQQEPEDEIPEKYRGKSIKELVQMHQEAEKVLGRQGSDLGELRKIADQYIMSQLKDNTAPPQPAVEEEEIDWFSDPDKALEQRLSKHPKLKEFEQMSLKQRQEASRAVVAQKHPDFRDIMNDPDFGSWITASKVRTKLFLEADQNYDADAADELFSLWKERKGLAKTTAEADAQARKSDVKKASTGGARGSSAPSAPKKYRRSDIIRLMNEDPERYAARADEFLRAYAEGRVV